MEKINLQITSAFGVEAVAKRELYRLGFSDTKSINGRINLSGEMKDIARLNLWLRSSDRVYLNLFEFYATTFDELFDNLSSFNWSKIIAKDGKILVNAKSYKSKLFALRSIQSISKKAIINSLSKKYTTLSERGDEYELEINILNDKVSVLLNTSGQSLHKRGYRDKVWKAPLKETLAASIVNLTVFNPEKPFIDPFCGSGTIPIETALIADNIAPGLFRKFAFENFNFIDSKIIETERERAKDLITKNKNPHIFGSDINPKAIQLAKHHAKNAGVNINFDCKDMADVTSDLSYGVIATNPPYGERLMTESELKVLYKNLMQMYSKLDNWSMYVLTGSKRFEDYAKKKANKKRKLFNAKIECQLYSYLGAKPPKNK